MMRSLVLSMLGLLIAFSPGLPAAEPKRLSVIDYFQRLPDQALEASAPEMWRFVQRSKDAVIDVANGYIRCAGDGAQGDFAVALFRYKDDRPLLAVCQGEPAETDYWYLHFYAPDADGNLQKLDRSLVPLGNEPRRRFELPRKGRTIVVSDTKSGKVQARFTWDGAQFVRER